MKLRPGAQAVTQRKKTRTGFERSEGAGERLFFCGDAGAGEKQPGAGAERSGIKASLQRPGRKKSHQSPAKAGLVGRGGAMERLSFPACREANGCEIRDDDSGPSRQRRAYRFPLLSLSLWYNKSMNEDNFDVNLIVSAVKMC